MNDDREQASARADRPRPAVERLVIALFAIAITLTAGCATPAAKSRFPEVAIHVTADGFVPQRAFAPRGQAVTLVVTRDTDQTCATAMTVDGIDKSWDLPLHQAVRIDLPQGVADTLHYICGMGMERGEVIAK
jgi:plastocyanin domain-containing protein